jgi:hypothetical protein
MEAKGIAFPGNGPSELPHLVVLFVILMMDLGRRGE